MEGSEILVHNLSHSDMILGIKTNSKAPAVARPKFSHFNSISELLYRKVKADNKIVSLWSSTLNSRKDTPKEIFIEPRIKVPVGYQFQANTFESTSPSNLRFRNDDTNSFNDNNCPIEYIYFPLISVLIHKWINNIEESHKSYNKIIVLVSGRGKPMDETAKESDNSTKYTAKLIQIFLNTSYPDLRVELVHSTTNLFRYDENIIFVKRELLPAIHKLRDPLIETFGAKWKDKLGVTLSFADGTSARISAINASLRHYRPSYMHFWVLKSFWRENKIYEDDVECHSYEEIATEPAVLSSEVTDEYVRKVIEEMDKFRTEVIQILSNPETANDISTFWLRKTKKPVLSVLLVEKNNRIKLYRGTNMEVSMPTGSLCAERNVIGTALADDLTLLRKDIKLIAVYSVNLNSIQSCDSLNKPRSDTIDSHEMLLAESSMSPEIVGDKFFNDPTCYPCTENPESPPKIRTSSITDGNTALAKSPAAGVKRKIFSMTKQSSTKDTEPDDINTSIAPKTNRKRKPISEFTSSGSKCKSIPFAQSISSLASLNNGKGDKISIVPMMTTIRVDESDMNPLKPCGACNEWLKKIAEVNPHLRVITFTDADCKGIYVEPVVE